MRNQTLQVAVAFLVAIAFRCGYAAPLAQEEQSLQNRGADLQYSSAKSSSSVTGISVQQVRRIHPADFSTRNPQDQWETVGDFGSWGQTRQIPGAVSLIKGINVVNGSLLNEVECFYMDQDGSLFLELEVYRGLAFSGQEPLVAELGSAVKSGATAPGEVESFSTSLATLVENDTYNYWLLVNWGGGNSAQTHRFYGCQISYTTTLPSAEIFEDRFENP